MKKVLDIFSNVAFIITLFIITIVANYYSCMKLWLFSLVGMTLIAIGLVLLCDTEKQARDK